MNNHKGDAYCVKVAEDFRGDLSQLTLPARLQRLLARLTASSVGLEENGIFDTSQDVTEQLY